MAQQTAMQLMLDELMAHEYTIPLSLIVKCKELIGVEKEQIEDAFQNGVGDEYEYHINNLPRINSETYYNETYGGDK